MPGGAHDNMRGWTPEEDEMLLQLIQSTGKRWKLIAEALESNSPCQPRTAAMVRNRFLRIERGRMLTEQGKSKNRCGQCGLLKRGHVCRAPRPLVSPGHLMEAIEGGQPGLIYADANSNAWLNAPQMGDVNIGTGAPLSIAGASNAPAPQFTPMAYTESPAAVPAAGGSPRFQMQPSTGPPQPPASSALSASSPSPLRQHSSFPPPMLRQQSSFELDLLVQAAIGAGVDSSSVVALSADEADIKPPEVSQSFSGFFGNDQPSPMPKPLPALAPYNAPPVTSRSLSFGQTADGRLVGNNHNVLHPSPLSGNAVVGAVRWSREYVDCDDLGVTLCDPATPANVMPMPVPPAVLPAPLAAF